MSTPNVIEVNEQDFRTDVVERSREVPVLLDFWAPWCGPCQVLGPMLEMLADEYDGAFVLAKVNTDANPGLSAAFRIQSIPTVALIKDGQPVDGFMGALPEPQIREFLSAHVKTGADDAVALAESLLEQGQLPKAVEMLEQVLAEQPDNTRAHLLLAKAALRNGDYDTVAEHLDAIPAQADEAADAQHVRDALVFRDGCAEDLDALRARVEKDESDLGARYQLGRCLAAQGEYGDALEELLEVVIQDKDYEDQAARKAMVTIFGLLGQGNPLASNYRRQLANYL